jgi:uncharacterized repeat protein (TIGR01451 family)
MRTTTFHRIYPRLSSASFPALFLLAALIGLLMPAAPVAAAPILLLNVTLSPGTPTPIPAGQPFRLRLTYECSSSLAGDECVNMVVTSTLSSPVGPLEGLQVVGNSDVQLANYDSGTGVATWTFKSPLPLGTTGQLEFEVRFRPGTTADGTTTTVTATIAADGATPTTSSSPTLTADSSDQSSITKVVEGGGAAGDVTTYRINVCPGGTGAVNLNNATITDTLPLGAVYISSNPPATSVDTGSTPQIVVWSGVNVAVPDCDAFRVTVNYPTSDPANVVGASKTNDATATGTPFGGVEKTITTNVTHTLAPPGPGFSLDKTADADTIVGGSVETRLRIRNTGNVQIDNVIVTDPIPAEHTVNRIDTGAATAVEYRKNGSATWIPGVPLGSNVLVGSFPGFIAGDYISGLRFTLGTVPVGFDNDGARIYSTIVNPPNGGGAAYPLPHNVTNTATLSGNFGGSPLADNNDGALTEVDVPKARPTPQKTIVSGSPALPGQIVNYRLTIANGNFAPLDNPVIADLLPAQVTYTPASWTLVQNITGCATTPTFSATPNFNGSGRTLLRWSWAGSGCSIPSGDQAQINFAVTVNAGTYPTGAGSIPNRLALVDFSTPTTLVRKSNCATPDPAEAAIYTGGGYNATKLCFSSPSGLRINAAASIGSAKYVRGQLDSLFHRDPQVGQTVQGGLITYQMELANTGNVDFQNLEIVDILPYDTPAPGNVGVRDLAILGTAWTPQLAGPVTISPPIPGLTVRYSSEINPCRPNLAPTNPGCVPMVDGVAPGAGVWSLNLPSDPTAVRSLKFDFGSYVLLANQIVRFTFPMFAPANAPFAGPGPNGTFGNNDDTNVAWNTFAYEAVRVDDGSRLVAQPPRVGIEVRPTPGGLASYGDYVWNDVNQNGSQDEPPYRGINGVTVRLYDDADGNPGTTGDQTLIGTQITHNDGSGNPGYYLFPALNPGFYFAEFMPPAGFQVSPKDTTADTIDSDINTVTGRTDITQLTAGENDLTWDAGFYAPVVSLGNRVWFDTNNDRLDNDGAGAVPGSSTGIPGVTVQLFLDANGDGSITGAEQNWFAQQTTDASGFYLFSAQTHSAGAALGSPVPLYPGQYVVGIAPSNFTGGGPLAGYHSSGTTISTAGLISEVAAPDPNNDTDRDDNGDTVRTPAVFYTGGVIGKPIFIDSSEPTGEPESAGSAPGPLPIADNNSNLTLDFGFYTASLGNLVWVDNGAGGGTIVNGLRDGGEAGLAGVTVRLFSQDNTTEILVGPDGLRGTADDAAGGMVTDATGAYRFGNLPQGQYRVRMTAPTGYVSTRDTAGTSSPNGNIDNDDNGPGVNAGTSTSSVITLTPGAAGTLNNNTVNSTAGSTLDPTIDFGIVRNYTLGNRVWNDRNNDGVRGSGEPGISGVVVRLYRSDGVTIARRIDGSNVPDSTTNATGYYRFDNLPAGDYIVEIIGSNFTGANPLVGFRSSTGTSGAYEPAGDPDNDIDNDDNGTFASGVARSQVITVGDGSGTAEPTSAVDGDGGVVSSPEAVDNQSNRTVDFGFYAAMSLGNRVWEDGDNNGTVNGAEAGISGVPVNLYRDNDNNNVPDGAAIATTTTNATGYYLFTGLITETYIIEIVSPAGYTSSTGNFGAYEPGPDADTVATDNDDNGSAGAGVIRSAPITLAVGGEPTGEPTTPGLTDDARDNNANYTVDFGLFRPLSLGNLVWLDADNNGLVSGGETGISDVIVRLYRDSDSNGTPDDLAAPAGVTPADAIRSMMTNASGHYLFTGLGAGDYIVEVVTPAGLTSSTGQTIPTPYEPAPDADTTPADDDDNGSTNAAVVRSAPVTLTVGGEPVGEPATPGLSDTTPDDSANYTVDFGFYTSLSLGNLVWLDADNSGTVNGGETGIAGITVRLYRDNDNDSTPDDIDGSAGITTSDAVATTTTNSTGHYLFTQLNAGTYIVEIVPPSGHRTSTGATGSYEPAPDADTIATDDDDNGSASAGVIRSAPITLTIGGEPSGEPATPGLPDSTADNNANYTVDFGLFTPVRLGNLIFEDIANNGVFDAGDSPLAGATVALFKADGTTPAVDADGVAVASQTTTATGLYLFDNLAPELYIVRVTPPAGYRSSTDIASSLNPNNDTDNDDNGVVSGGIVATAAPVILTSSGEPAVAVDTDDTSGNLTIDFGFYQPLRLGNLVFEDIANNGVYDSGTDSPLASATVALFQSDGTTPAVDADGVAVASQTTTATGLYLFDNLAPGQYVVRVTPPTSYRSSTDIVSTTNPNNDTDNDDNGIVSGLVVASNPVTLTSHGEPAVAVDADDTSGNLTIDFGFYQPLRLGNLVFEDIANNGVFDAGDSPLASATVALFQSDGTTPAVDADGVAVASQTTTATGLYLFDNLAPGQYVVRVTPPTSYRSSTDIVSTTNPNNDTDNDDNGIVSGLVVASNPVTLTSHGEPAVAVDADDTSGNLTIDFGFFLPAEIGDVVWLDVNKDGVQDGKGSEPGIPGVIVTLYQPGPDGTPGTVDDVLVANTTTNATGDYLFTNLGAGDYFVQFGLPLGYDRSPQGGTADPTLDSDADLATGRTVITTLVPGESDLTWDTGIFYTASLGDRVWLDQNGNGVQDAGESGIPGVTVTLFTSGGTQVGAPTTTDATGIYAFPNLPPSDYYVQFTPPSGYISSPANQGGNDAADSDADATGRTAITTITPGESDPTWDAGMYIPVSLGNLVWSDVNNNGLVDGGESGINGVVVNLYHDTNSNSQIDAGEMVATQTTSGGGLYLFDNLIPGSYLVQLPASNFTNPGVLVGYRSSTGRIGTHISATGPYEPAPGPNNDINNDDNGSAVNGQGIISAQIVLTSNGEPTNDGDSSPNSNLTIDFGVFQPASLGSIVWYDTDRDGVCDSGETGVPNVTVTLYDSAGNPIATASTDSTGFFQFTNLPPGSYSVGFSNLPSGYTFTQANQGSDDSNDSDANPNTGLTSPITLTPGQNNPTLYAGIVVIIPTAITLASFTAMPEGDTIAVRWVTTAERNTWGFHLYRSDDGDRTHAVRVTSDLILGQGRGQGATYSWTDTTVEAGVRYTYWLQEVEADSTTNEYGPATTTANSGTGGYRIFLPLSLR